MNPGLLIFISICLLRFITPYVIEAFYRREVPRPRGLGPGRDALVEEGRRASLSLDEEQSDVVVSER